jgi:hypothetical protein
MHIEDVLWIPPSGAMVSLGNTKEDFIQAYKEWYAGANKVEVIK